MIRVLSWTGWVSGVVRYGPGESVTVGLLLTIVKTMNGGNKFGEGG